MTAVQAGSAPRWEQWVPIAERERLLAAGFGTSVSMGARPCLLVIDVTLAFLGDRTPAGDTYPTACGEQGWRTLPVILELLGLARRAGIPRVLSTGSAADAGFVGGAIKLSSDPRHAALVHGAPFPAEIDPQADEYVLAKAKASAFFGTPLLSYLHRNAVDTLIVAGATTSGCVRATVVDGASHGYPVFVAEDACFDRSPFAHASNLFDIQMKYGSVVDTEWLGPRLDEMGNRRLEDGYG